MTRVEDRLEALRGQLEERVVDDFEAVIARRAPRRRRAAIAIGVAAATVGVAGAGWFLAGVLTGPAAKEATGGHPSPAGQIRVTAPSPPPCGPGQRLLSLPQARSELGSKLLLSSTPDANASNVKTVAICDPQHIVTVFNNGASVDITYDVKPDDWKAAVADDPNESELGMVHGSPAWVIMPRTGKYPANGAVTFNIKDTEIVVGGNTHLGVDALLAIARSIPRGQ